MKLALVQLNPLIGALHQNTKRIKQFYRSAVHAGAELVIFPEMALTGYPPLDLLMYKGFVRRAENLLVKEIVPLTASSAAILIGSAWRSGTDFYNAAVLLENGTVKAVHPKTLLPNYDVFNEPRYFTRSPARKVEILAGEKTGITVGEDLWNDHDFWEEPLYDVDPVQELVDLGAGLIINLSGSPYHFGKQTLREKMISFMAQKHRAGFIYINQVGGNDELVFDGSSLVFNNRGELIQRGASFQEQLLLLDLDSLYRPAGSPLAPAVEDIDTIYRCLCLGIKDYLHKTGFRKAVIGLSGGIDSAVTAALAVAALGADNVLGVLMPSPYSAPYSIEDALELAGNLKIKHRTIPIDIPFQNMLQLFNPGGKPVQDLAEENLQARIRGNIIMFISNREGCLPLTTSNKSEFAVGYCTLYGDMAGGLAVLADVPKMMVYELARYLNTLEWGKIIPERTIARPPSAELRPNQKDQDSLPPYENLDPILKAYIEENKSLDDIIHSGFPRDTVLAATRLVDRAEYKRRQAAPVLRVTARAFGPGRRMPVARGYEEY